MDLDRMVTEQVMNWPVYDIANQDELTAFLHRTHGYPHVASGYVMGERCWIYYEYDRAERWAPSTRLPDAWNVIEALAAKGTIIRVGPYLPGRYAAYLSYAPQYFPEDCPRFVSHTPMVAICRAALAAVKAARP
jgi:hypothetical protein